MWEYGWFRLAKSANMARLRRREMSFSYQILDIRCVSLSLKALALRHFGLLGLREHLAVGWDREPSLGRHACIAQWRFAGDARFFDEARGAEPCQSLATSHMARLMTRIAMINREMQTGKVRD